ncbi:MAG: hypothetical protein K9K37_05970 [Desulfocapsa sp.]|nr:hypothetical protein [Desulfocapsa sp.]
MKDKFDKQEGYCKMLGHFLTFDYCRSMNKGLPCSKVLDCWFQIFPVQEFITNNFSAEEQKKIFEAPKSKMLTLTEILEQAQQRLKETNQKE